MRSRYPGIALATILTLAAAAPAHADELQAQIVAGARATRADAYAFRRTLTIERTGAARKTIVESYDPRRPAGRQWLLASIDGRAPTAKEAADAAKAKRGSTPSYGELAKWIGAPATRSDAGAGYVAYRYASLPKGTIKLGSHDASADTRAEVLVNVQGKAPFVERIRFTSTKGFRMMLVAAVKAMTVTARYRAIADGQFVPEGSASELTGSMMGKDGHMRTTVAYSDMQKVR
ncbi:hypothetical protein M9980_00850 [Sphingomonas donggukensis]|uniref:Outer membrane lipoprotein-sorting protein n=1 Tax=Sphingomonas donggukensis TaxID=2949093 RepID=A0ABY4TU60_9SPHN|nr:hypothetical protein [Sphingomonas donggukensis]URW75817.1 hypothetical protein M9980_00850 [Sphingomonas donggukensis]